MSPKTNMAQTLAAVAVTTVAVLATCSQSDAILTSGSAARAPSQAATAPVGHASDKAGPKTRVIANNLDVPWGIVFLPNGGILVGGRDNAKIFLINQHGGKSLARKVKGVVPNGHSGGEAGLLGLALSPHFARDHWVYAYISAPSDNRVIRMKYANGRLGRQFVIFTGIPRSLHHNGGRIGFGPDHMLYVTTGDAENSATAQNRHTLGGKILRMTPRGKPAPGNPFRHSVVYSYGHRNVEGLDWDSHGRLWATEFGENAWDELNLIHPGGNYGWPIVEGRSSDHRFINPKTVWRTQNAGPSGIAITRIGGQTVAFIGALTGQRLWRVELTGTKVTGRRALFVGRFGRIRSTAVARGSLWMTSSNTDGRATPGPGDDKLFRVRIGSPGARIAAASALPARLSMTTGCHAMFAPM